MGYASGCKCQQIWLERDFLCLFVISLSNKFTLDTYRSAKNRFNMDINICIHLYLMNTNTNINPMQKFPSISILNGYGIYHMLKLWR